MTKMYTVLAGIAGALIVGLLAGWHFGSLHWKGKYQELVASQDRSSAQAAADAQARDRKAREQYDEQLKGISDAYHREIAAADTTADGLARQLRAYESRLSRCTVPSSASPAAGAHDAGPEPSVDPRVATAVGRVIADSKLDAAQLSALQAERRTLR